MLAILIKEINEFLDSLIAYVVMGVFLTGIGLLIWVFPETNVLDYGFASMETLFALGPYVFMFLIPAITMKSLAEEKRSGTIELLYTLPFRNYEIILGKFFAGFLLVVVAVLPTLIYYFSLQSLGNPPGNMDTPGIIGSYIGLILLGGVFTAVGLFASALAQNQIVAFILSAFLCFLLYAGFDSISQFEAFGPNAYIIQDLGMLAHYNSLSRGLIDLTDLAYFIGLAYLSLLFTLLVLKKK
jgi:ABC-2 type transport system permease protein